MWKHIETKTRKITKPLALEHANLKSVEGERDLSNVRMSYLEDEILNNRVTVFRWATASVKGQSTLYRVNGNHSSHLLSNGCPIPDGATATIERYECESRDDLGALWATFDPRRSARSPKEILKTHLRMTPRFRELPERTGMLARNVLSLAIHGWNQQKLTDHDKCLCLNRHPEFVLWLDEMLGTADGRKMFGRTGAGLAMFKTWQVDRNECKRFWNEVLTGENPLPKSGSRLLQKLLLTTQDKKGQSKVNQKMDWKQTCHLAVLAWNHWRKNSTVNSLRYVATQELPKAI